jgi:hypothetical protein
MKAFIALKIFLTIINASSWENVNFSHQTRNPAQSIVTLSLIPQILSPNNEQSQQPTISKDNILTVIVGQTLSSNGNLLQLQGMEMIHVSAGVSLSGDMVAPKRVVCIALNGFSGQSAGTAKLGGGPIAFGGRETVIISTIECY